MHLLLLLPKMARTAPRTPLFVFGFVALYIILQSAWWMWLLVSKDRDLYALQQQLIAEGAVPYLPVRTPDHTLRMVGGEGGVFLVLLLLALLLTYRTLRHELSLARQQRDFLLAASHELRTPIAGLKLHLQTLQRTDLDGVQRGTLASNALDDVVRLHALTEKILLATRLDEAKLPLAMVPVDAAAQTRAVIAVAQRSYGRDHVITFSAPTNASLSTDEEAFRSVLENLLENACKYSHSGSTVEVVLTNGTNAMELSVRDAGAGVAAHERTLIFHKFHRAGNEETRGTKGTGLGLFIVHRLMQALGGTIEHRERSPKGSIFTATFPQRP